MRIKIPNNSRTIDPIGASLGRRAWAMQVRHLPNRDRRDGGVTHQQAIGTVLRALHSTGCLYLAQTGSGSERFSRMSRSSLRMRFLFEAVRSRGRVPSLCQTLHQCRDARSPICLASKGQRPNPMLPPCMSWRFRGRSDGHLHVPRG